MKLDFEKMGGLIPAIVQDNNTSKVLMLGFMNQEAYDETVSTGKVTFFSRTKNRLWMKGESSGNTLQVVSITADCDNDTLLIKAIPAGPVCHTGADTCFGEKNVEDIMFLKYLQNFIERRRQEMPEGSYTTTLFQKGVNRMAQKVGEEAVETVIEATNGTEDGFIYEASDLVYHLIVLLTSKGLRLENRVLHDACLTLRNGEFVYVIGKVGSGKSSLLKSLYCEIPILRGEARIMDYNLTKMKRKDIPYLRRKLGIVFQDFQLLTDRSVSKNLEFVLKATGWKKKSEIKERIDNVLRQVGMQDKGYKMPHELSGGEQQRIVIARALLNNPKLILADEPTGNLDPETSGQIVQLLHDICQQGTAVIMTTHNYTIVHNYPARIVKCENACLSDVRE